MPRHCVRVGAIHESNSWEHQERLQRVLPVARFEMNSLYQQIVDSGFVISQSCWEASLKATLLSFWGDLLLIVVIWI